MWVLLILLPNSVCSSWVSVQLLKSLSCAQMRMERGNKQRAAQGGQGELSSGEEQQINAVCCLCSENRPCSEAGKVRGRPCKAARGAPPNPWWRCVGLRGARCKAGEVKAAALPEGGLQPSASFPPQLLVCFCGTRQEQQRAASVCTARGFLGVFPPPPADTEL